MNFGIRWIATVLLLFTFGCAFPNHKLYPPQPGAVTHEIIVSVDSTHAMIAMALESASSPQQFEEWGYAEKAWYLDGDNGFAGMLRNVFTLSDGVVEVGTYHQVWADRTPKPPSEKFIFQLSEEGYTRLRRYLQSTIASPEPIRVIDGSRFYLASRSYNVIVFHCHRYAAYALREAGLPVNPVFAVGREAFAVQLRDIAPLAEDGKAEPAS